MKYSVALTVASLIEPPVRRKQEGLRFAIATLPAQCVGEMRFPSCER